MREPKKNRFYVVDGQNGRPDISGIEEELQRELFEGRQQKKKIFRRRAVVITAVLVAAVTAVSLFIYLQTYTKVRVSDTFEIGNASDNSYQEFADGVLKYSRDGISYLNQRGEEQWNQPYQIKSPMLDVNREAAAVADRGGNTIMIFQPDGLKGEVQTTLPIERISVSGQGIVAAILKNESAPRILCYDAAGNVLVEHKASPGGTGYPLDLSISADGEVLQVVYLVVKDGVMTSRVSYYNFGEAGEEETDHQVTDKEYAGSLMAAGFYIDDTTSAAVGDNCLTIFEGKEKPREKTTVEIKEEIQSVFHSETYIGLVVKEKGKSGYRLCLYSTAGKLLKEIGLEGTYQSYKICGGQVIMCDGRKCSIYLKNGIHRFEGEMDNDILEMFPVGGVNKYIVMNANGMENVRLVK